MEIKRDQYLNQLIRKKDNGRVKIITGVRRCGKSYLLFELFRKYLLEEGVVDAGANMELKAEELKKLMTGE
jgi:hypothetical protein